MSVSFSVGRESWEIGAAAFLKAFFSTIFVRLENRSWGNRFPTIMNQLYSGRLSNREVESATVELKIIRDELSAFSPDQIIWDFEDETAQPPWGSKISQHITSLANYFVTSRGKDLFEVLFDALESATRNVQDVSIA